MRQKQRSIASLHESTLRIHGISPILEISSKSPDEIGVRLSAFNLQVSRNTAVSMSVESAFQGSKVFENGGPYIDLYKKPSREAKKDRRLYESGSLQRFEFLGHVWPLLPRTAFYDWLYISALVDNPTLSDKLLEYAGFTDIEFNPKKSINCQARAAALFVSLHRHDLLNHALLTPNHFISTLEGGTAAPYVQPPLL